MCGRIGHTQNSCRLAESHVGKLPESISLRRAPIVRVSQSPRRAVVTGIGSPVLSPSSKSSFAGGSSSSEPPVLETQGAGGEPASVLPVRCLSGLLEGTTSPFSISMIGNSLDSPKSKALPFLVKIAAPKEVSPALKLRDCLFVSSPTSLGALDSTPCTKKVFLLFGFLFGLASLPSLLTCTCFTLHISWAFTLLARSGCWCSPCG